MPEYRRWFVPGGTYFFTVVTKQRAPLFRNEHARHLLRESFAKMRRNRPFEINAMVLLPDHLHTIWTLPPGDADFSTRWSMVKRLFTQAWLTESGGEQIVSSSQARRRRRGVWQRRFWEHVVRHEQDYIQHCDYIHYNPVKHGLADCPHAWPYSSFARFVAERRYAADWCCTCEGRQLLPPTFDSVKETAIE